MNICGIIECMAQSNPSERFNGIRAMGEDSRDPAVKEIRNAIVDRTNNFLEELAQKRHSEVPQTPGEFVLQQSSVVTETVLGTTGNIRHVGVDYRPGISLTGGSGEPLVLQAVLPKEWIEGSPGLQVITMTGTDPTARIVHGDHNYDFSRRNEQVASFEVREAHGGIENGNGYTVMGDGALRHNYVTDQGVRAGHPVADEEAARAAQAHLEELIEAVQGSLAS